MRVAHDEVMSWVDMTGDEDLGLKAAALMCLGEWSALEFAMRSAASLRDCVCVARRYKSLLSEAVEPSLHIEGDQALIRLEMKPVGPRAAADLMLGSWYRSHVQIQLRGTDGLECWIAHRAPEDTREYERMFAGATLRFDAPAYGFAFRAGHVDRPLAASDAMLHCLHCEYLDSRVTRLCEPAVLAQKVRVVLSNEFGRGRPSSSNVALALKMSRRTLVRRLAEEGTTFKHELDGLRRELALTYMASQISISEVTCLVGFSHVQAFHRAFRRWTGQTPAQFRAPASAALVTERPFR